MSKVLLDFEGFKITGSGEVLFKHDAVVDLIRRRLSIEDISVLENDDVRLTNRRHPENLIKIAKITDIAETPPDSCYKFILPDQYLNIDLDEYLAEKLVDRDLYLNDIYIRRVDLEMKMIIERNMEDFVRALIYMVDVFEENNVVHGVGRGSSCASLVLYLIGVHLVDPIEYDLEITEFLR